MDRFPAYTDLFSRLEVLQLLQINLAHVDTRRAEYLSIAHLADASNEACNAWPGWVRGRLAICQLQVWSQICVLPWTTALHWARPTPLHRFAPICDGYGLRSGDEAVKFFYRVAAKCNVWSRTCVDVRGGCIIASRDQRRGCSWECVAASQARKDGQLVGVAEVTGDRCCYLVLMIGC